MGSSKSGSLDGLAKFSLPAAIGAGKIKLPETGIVGMLQARQEDKMNQGAQMAQQDDNQMAQYMKMMQQQINPGMNMGGRVGLSEGGEPSMERVLELEEQGFSYEEAYEKAMQELLDYKGGFAAGGPVESMNFLKQHLPYQDGGHVALRRKMFKLGGPVNTHGIGITSGLEYRNNYNAGGAVAPIGQVGKGPLQMKGPDGKMREMQNPSAIIKAITEIGKAAPRFINKPITKKVIDRDEILKILRAGGSGATGIGKVGKGIMTSTPPSVLRKLSRAGLLATPFSVASGFMDSPDPFTEDKVTPARRILDTGRFGAEFLSDFNPYAIGATALLQTPKLFDEDTELGDVDFSLGSAIRRLTGNQKESKSGDEILQNQNLGAPPASYGDAVDDLQKQQMEEQISRYVELLQGNDDQNKLAMLGDSLIGAGSALMAGEGYGAAGQAFNDPLSEKLRARDERKQAVRQGAAELAIGQDISRKTADEAMTRELLATGQIGTAEEIKKYNYAMALGADAVVPQNEKEELDLEALEKQGYRGRVLADPRNLVGQGALFLAINKNGEALPFNDIEAAREYAAG